MPGQKRKQSTDEGPASVKRPRSNQQSPSSIDSLEGIEESSRVTRATARAAYAKTKVPSGKTQVSGRVTRASARLASSKAVVGCEKRETNSVEDIKEAKTVRLAEQGTILGNVIKNASKAVHSTADGGCGKRKRDLEDEPKKVKRVRPNEESKATSVGRKREENEKNKKIVKRKSKRLIQARASVKSLPTLKVAKQGSQANKRNILGIVEENQEKAIEVKDDIDRNLENREEVLVTTQNTAKEQMRADKQVVNPSSVNLIRASAKELRMEELLRPEKHVRMAILQMCPREKSRKSDDEICFKAKTEHLKDLSPLEPAEGKIDLTTTDASLSKESAAAPSIQPLSPSIATSTDRPPTLVGEQMPELEFTDDYGLTQPCDVPDNVPTIPPREESSQRPSITEEEEIIILEGVENHTLRDINPLTAVKDQEQSTGIEEGLSIPFRSGVNIVAREYCPSTISTVVPSTGREHHLQRRLKDPSAPTAAAADDLVNSPQIASNKGAIDECDDIAAAIADINPYKVQQLMSSETRRYPSAATTAAAGEISGSGYTSSGEDVRDNNEFEGLELTTSTSSIGPQAATSPLRPSVQDSEDVPCEAFSYCARPVEEAALQIVDTSSNSSKPTCTHQEESLADELIEAYRHEAIDIDDPAKAKKYKIRCPDNNLYEEKNDIDDNDDVDDDGEFRIDPIAPTWEIAMQSAMIEVIRLDRIDKDGDGNTSIPVPRDHWMACFQYEVYSKFKRAAERTLLRYRRALDDIRYTKDGTIREELREEERDRSYDYMTQCYVINDQFKYDPPMIPAHGINSYFNEENLEPAPLPSPPESMSSPEPLICHNTPVSNMIFELEESKAPMCGGDPDQENTSNDMTCGGDPGGYELESLLSDSETDFGEPDAFLDVEDSQGEAMDEQSTTAMESINNDSYDHETSTMGDTGVTSHEDESHTGGDEGSAWNHPTNEPQFEDQAFIRTGTAAQIQEQKEDAMHLSLYNFDAMFRLFERNKKAIGKWSREDRRRERKNYAKVAYKLANHSMEATPGMLPRWRSEMTAVELDDLVASDVGGAIVTIDVLMDRLHKARTLLKHSIMDAKTRARVLEDEREIYMGQNGRESEGKKNAVDDWPIRPVEGVGGDTLQAV
ncbi:MAG: hypothetical protein M1836_004570 [Candelina mexicana]|nr:MAG: hypothetical protein M1836_004570 [Candelina mexicana]